MRERAMADTKFTEEAHRLAQKAQSTDRPSEKRMLETYSRFYEALAEEPAQPVKVEEPPLSDED
jgi:hypothetical protein